MNRTGQGLVEYLVLVCLIAVSAISIVSVVGKNIQEQYTNVSQALRGESKISLSRPEKKNYDWRGMDDFMEGARKPKGE